MTEKSKEQQLEEAIEIIIKKDISAWITLLTMFRTNDAVPSELLQDILWDRRIDEEERKFLFLYLTEDEKYNLICYIAIAFKNVPMKYLDNFKNIPIKYLDNFSIYPYKRCFILYKTLDNMLNNVLKLKGERYD